MNTFPILSELSDAQIVAAARAAGEPAWLIARRVAAWQQFAESQPPFWKRTDLSKFRAETIAAPRGADQTTLLWDERLAAQGVVFLPLATALHSHAALVERYLDSAVNPAAHKFAALRAALWQDGALLYIPRDVAVESPLHVRFAMPDGANAIFPRVLVILEPGARATFVEEYVSNDRAGQALAGPISELFLGAGASLRFVSAQTWGRGVYHIGGQLARVGDDASLEWVALNLGGTLQHTEAETFLGGNGARVEWRASTFAAGEQTLVNAPWLRHVGVNTEGHMDFKTVVNAGGYTVFDGMIKIEKQSRGTISRLEEHAIHLGEKARSDSIPGLMIDTNDVQRAGHASTSGQVDEEILFYMRARGIRREEAIRMIVYGFFEPVLDRVPEGALRERIAGLIERKI
jgi:Fe-S cluster assembly protein SufD